MNKPMHILIVEGNIEATRVERENFGILPFHLLFPQMLKKLDPTVKTKTVFPADDDRHLPTLQELENYDGVMWTGSALHVFDDKPEVTRQLNFANEVFESGVPFYGSCWGMQVATVVSGGEVAPNPNGLEVGITEAIKLTKEGLRSPFYNSRKDNFKALCIHLDEVIKLPEKAIVLAANNHSKVQAMTIDYKRSQFFGIQYHPEFRTKDMALIMSFLAKDLVKKGSFSSLKEVNDMVRKLLDQKELPLDITDYNIHTQEIKAWLDFIKLKNK